MLNFIENFLFKIDLKVKRTNITKYYGKYVRIIQIIKYDWRIYAKNRKEKVKLKT